MGGGYITFLLRLLFHLTNILLFLLILKPNAAFAVNFYDGSRAQGTYLLTYTSVYAAEETTDKSGDVGQRNYGYFNAQELLRLCYYSHDFVATVLVPFGETDIRSLNQNSSGIGDINLGAGYFLPLKKIDILPMLFVEFPTGVYDASKTANIGSNQYDIKPMIFLYKSLGDFSIDAAVKYYFRLQNETTRVAPGDELYVQCLFGYNVTDKFKWGPSINWMISSNESQNGVAVANRSRETLSMGADFYYRFSWLSVTFTYLYDVYTENSTKGHFFQLKTVYHF